MEIKNSLVQNVPSSIPLSFRLPADIIRWSSGNPSASSFGFINDCWLAGADDEGTFLSNDERTYIQSLTLTRPFGGETCSDPSVVLRNSCAESVAEAKLYHLTYLNSGYSLDFINRWKSENCFIDIAKKMGHRFVLVDLKFPKLLSINGTLHLELKINNSGFSKIFKERIVYAVLKNISTGEKININLGNLVSLMPNSNMTYGVDLNLVGSGIKAGSYDVYIGMPDQSLLKINEIALANNAFNSIRPINSDSPGKNQNWDFSNSQFKTGAVIQIQ